MQLAPDLAQAHFLYGLELGRAGQPAEAVRELRAVVRLMPDVVEARLDLGLALSDQGQTEEARREFEWVLQRQPTNERALRQIEILRQGTGKIR